MKKISKFLIPSLIFVSLFLMLIMPVFSFAQDDSQSDGLVPCGRSDASGNIANPCDFNDIMALINKVIHFILYFMVIPIAAIMFAYAGVLLITAGGEVAHARTKAKSIFINVLIGLIIAMAAFLIIRTILSILGYEGGWIGF
ncbi:MAG: hypothetical protein WC870_02205 [Candidatus Paceibacterota bacterium]